jgi:rhomboid protease GluP
VPFVTGTCIVLYAISLVLSGPGVFGVRGFDALSPGWLVLRAMGAAGAIPVFDLGRWWTVLSAGWLHGGVLHILFNLMWIRQLAPSVGELYGPGRMVVIYTIAGVVGFSASSIAGEYLRFMPIPILQGGDQTVGASAPIFGLLGAIVYYGRRTGSSLASSQAWGWAVAMFVFGLILPGVDNYAHAGGFAGGYWTGRLLDPLKPERIDHLVWALVCLGLSMLAVVGSVLHWFVLLSRYGLN